eukprot:8717881-Pyramimonas_sp.AAC.1
MKIFVLSGRVDQLAPPRAGIPLALRHQLIDAEELYEETGITTEDDFYGHSSSSRSSSGLWMQQANAPDHSQSVSVTISYVALEIAS